MRALVYPADGYIASNVLLHLQRSGHDVISWQQEGEVSEGSQASWAAGLQQATAVFHVLHGHDAHARDTVQQLLRARTKDNPVTFIGISTPLTWAATPAPPPLQHQLPPGSADSSVSSISSNSSEDSDASHHADEAAAAAGAGPAFLTDKDAATRRPAVTALQTYQAEQLILRCNRPGRLHTYIVCPGVLYGLGEDDSQLHMLFKTAWEGKGPLSLLGPGLNRLPTVHVADLAVFAVAVAQQQPQGSQYLLCADNEAVQQRELVTAVGQLLSNKNVETRGPTEALLQPPPSPLLQLDLPIAPSQLPQPQGLERRCPRGLLHHLPQVLTEYLTARNLTPVRILIRGPPAAGKTHLAARLSEQYDLLHVNTASILAELPLMDSETQKAANAQLASKEGRISQQLMAKMAQHLLARHPEATNQGWVMEGWPKSLQAARLFTSGPAGDGGKAAADRAARRTTGGVAKDKKSSGTGVTSTTGAALTSSTAGATRNRRTTLASDEPMDGSLTQQNPELLPHFLIELDVPEDELIRRVKTLAAAESAAAAASAAAGSAIKGSPSKGSKPVSAAKGERAGSAMSGAGDKGSAAGVSGSHNNEKDWGRRMEAYKQLLQEDAADLAANRAAILDAIRAANTPDSTTSTSSPGRRDKASTGGKAPTSMEASMELPPDVKLPEYGGFVAYFVDSGTKYLKVSNPFDELASTAASAFISTPHQQQQQQDQQQQGSQQLTQLPPLPVEQQVMESIGPPHNYQGFPGQQDGHAEHTSTAAADADSGAEAPGAAAATATAGGGHALGRAAVPGLHLGREGASVLPEMAELLAFAQVLTSEQADRDHQKLHRAAQPLVSHLIAGVMPALMSGLVKTALHRPDDPFQVIADELLKVAEEIESGYKDPYNDPIYGIQLAKVEAKAAREAARAEAAAAKAAREDAARAAVAAQAEAEAAAAAATAANNGSYGTGGGGSAVAKPDDPASRPVSAAGGAKHAKPAARGSTAASRPASSMRPR